MQSPRYRGQCTAAFALGGGRNGKLKPGQLVQVWDSGSGPGKEQEAREEVPLRVVSSLASKGPVS